MQPALRLLRKQATSLVSKQKRSLRLQSSLTRRQLSSTVCTRSLQRPSASNRFPCKQVCTPTPTALFYSVRCRNLHYFENCNKMSSNASKTSGRSENTSKTSKRGARIYTRTGDKGTSALFTAERRDKDDPVFDALGNTDELNAAIGIAREYCIQANNGLDSELEEIQSRLIDIGAAIATPETSDKATDAKKIRVHFDASNTAILEQWIDKLDAQLPPLRNFILPSGGLASSHLHLARAVCRRSERSLIALMRNSDLQESVTIYINRLSDYLFMAARYAAQFEKKPEIIYQKPKTTESKGDK